MNNATKCYACNADATGKVDHNGEIKPACARHAQAKLGHVDACLYCGVRTRPGSIRVDGEPAHAKCHRIACNDGEI